MCRIIHWYNFAQMENLFGRFSGAYKVQTPVYEGPLDLLLQLIERAELDITAVALALVTDQYLTYLQSLDEQRPDEISAFLVIAAKLVLIKSEALLPRPPEREAGEEDPGASLVEQLKLYKRYKEIGGLLEIRQEAGLRTYVRIAPPPRIEPRLDLSNLTVERLVNLATAALTKRDERQALSTVIAPPRITIREKIELIASTMRRIKRLSFSSLIPQKASRMEVVVTFLAFLELIKRFHIVATQPELFGDIEFEKLGDWKDDDDLELEFE